MGNPSESNVPDFKEGVGTYKLEEYHPSVEHVLQFFTYTHLPEHLQVVSKDFQTLALMIAGRNPQNPETTVALRKLLEAKDAAVRAEVLAHVGR